MMSFFGQKLKFAVLYLTSLLIITSCAPEIKLASSWTNKDAKVKKAPLIMVIVLGKPNSSIRQDAENKIVGRLKKEGFNAVPASDLIPPGPAKHDSVEVVNILRKNNIDMLLTNAVVNVVENERFIPGALQGTTVQDPNAQYGASYNNYYSYYNYYNNYQVIDAPKTPGVTVTDVEVVIQSNLFEVSTPALIWYGRSKIFTKEPSKNLITAFSKTVVDDIKKHKLLIK
jgi:hypothetical protein